MAVALLSCHMIQIWVLSNLARLNNRRVCFNSPPLSSSPISAHLLVSPAASRVTLSCSLDGWVGCISAGLAPTVSLAASLAHHTFPYAQPFCLPGSQIPGRTYCFLLFASHGIEKQLPFSRDGVPPRKQMKAR